MPGIPKWQAFAPLSGSRSLRAEAGDRIDGPALIEEHESTCVVGRGDHVSVDEHLNLIIEVGAMSMSYDPVALGIQWDRLISIADEVVSALVRTSFSTNVRESYDLSCVLFDSEGRSLAQGTYSVPSFTGTAPATLQQLLAGVSGQTRSSPATWS